MADAAAEEPPAEELESNLRVRPLREDDYAVLELLAQLTFAPRVPRDAFAERVQELAAGQERVLVVTDGDDGPLLAVGTLLLERKLARGLGLCGHIEDFVVHESVRGTGIGRILLEALVDLGRVAGCYKVILDSPLEAVGFFEKCYMFQNDVAMALYFDPPPPLRFPVEPQGPGETLHSWHMTI